MYHVSRLIPLTYLFISALTVIFYLVLDTSVSQLYFKDNLKQKSRTIPTQNSKKAFQMKSKIQSKISS